MPGVEQDNGLIFRVRPSKGFKGEVRIPGDKSISHRAIMLGSIAEGVTRIENFLPGDDCISTVNCFRSMGVDIDLSGDDPLGMGVTVSGKGLSGLKEPEDVLDAGNSGTTMRLIMGILAGLPFFSTLTGDHSLRRRPMGRVARPLREMGAEIWGRQGGNLAPLAINGRQLQGAEFTLPVASAQMKSAIILAGLNATGTTTVTEPARSRDHSERMLRYFGVDIKVDGNTVSVAGPVSLKGQPVTVPGDISSAAFFMVAAAVMPDAVITMRNIGTNPSRSGIIDVLAAMGASIRVENEREVSGEPVADIVVSSSELKGVQIGGDLIPRLIDEIPVIAVAAACATGVTEIRDAAELKVKESDRLAVMAKELSRFGAAVEELPDGLRIYGGRRLRGASCHSHCDHRIAMSLSVAGLVAEGETVIDDAACASISFPGFREQFKRIVS